MKKYAFTFFAAILLCMACDRTENRPWQPGINTAYNRVGKLVSAYLDLKNALTDSDVGDAKVEAKQLAEKASEAESDHAAEIQRLAAAIAETDDLEKQRELFAGLSSHVIAFAKKDLPADRRMYVLHCPRALGNKGADWLSEAKDPHNPYFGQKVLNCGEIKEEILGTDSGK